MRTGAIHFLSVSGFHVGIVAGFVWLLCRTLGLRRWLNGTLILLAIAVYLLIVPPRPPVLRAAIICSSFALAYLTRRKANSLNLISLAAMIILLIRPLDLFNAGFQLSFVVVLAIISSYPTFHHHRRLIDAFKSSAAPPIIIKPPLGQRQFWWQGVLRYLLRYVRGLVVVALVAWFAGLPLAAYHFHRIPPWGPITSIILYPLICLTMMGGLAKLIIAAVFPIAAVWLAYPLSQLARVIITVTDQLGRLPMSSINTAAPPLLLIVIFYALLIFMARFLRQDKSVPRSLTIALAMWAVVFFGLLPFGAETHRKGNSTLSVLSVGHGCAAIVQLPDGKTIAYDAGSRTNFAAGESIIIPFLRSQGIGRLDALIISHPDMDHYSAVPDLCGNFPVKNVYLTDYFMPTNAPDRKLLRELKSMGLPVHRVNDSTGEFLSTGNADESSYEIQILWPPPQESDLGLEGNDTSLVLRIKDAHGAILLPGDIGEVPQRALAQLPPERIASDVLILPHHGTATRVLPAFIEAVNPRVIINSSGLLSPNKANALAELLGGRQILHTYRRGGVTTQLTPVGLQTQTFH